MSAPQPVKLFNTLTRRIEPLTPITPGSVSMYCCGPTVYDYQHIGNFKTFLFEDVLVRTLRFAGYTVRHVMNITDVGHLVGDEDSGEDKMLVAARREKKKSFEIAQFYTDKFFEDWDKLHLLRPTIVCKATDHIADMVQLIERIEHNGFAYLSGGNVYFDSSKCADYGKLARLNLEGQKAGARIDVDPNKRNPFDFVLWFTKSKFENQELQWDSPWGRGYPGWHIECSAMSMKHLGENFDIHCGGIDHIPVHHTAEIAQSEAAIGREWVPMWLHSEFMLINAEKMAKSKGKTILVDDLIEKGFDPIVFRYVCLTSHYRSQLNFTWAVMENARSALEKLRSTVIALKTESAGAAGEPDERVLEEFRVTCCDDLNTPKAFALVWEVVADKTMSAPQKIATLLRMDDILGLGVSSWQESEISIPEAVHTLVTQREAARKSKNWTESDRLRDEIRKHGFVIKDSSEGSTLKKA